MWAPINTIAKIPEQTSIRMCHNNKLWNNNTWQNSQQKDDIILPRITLIRLISNTCQSTAGTQGNTWHVSTYIALNLPASHNQWYCKTIVRTGIASFWGQKNKATNRLSPSRQGLPVWCRSLNNVLSPTSKDDTMIPYILDSSNTQYHKHPRNVCVFILALHWGQSLGIRHSNCCDFAWGTEGLPTPSTRDWEGIHRMWSWHGGASAKQSEPAIGGMNESLGRSQNRRVMS